MHESEIKHHLHEYFKLAADGGSDALYVGTLQTVLPDEITSQKEADQYIEQYYQYNIGTEELRERLRAANRQHQKEVGMMEDVVSSDNFKSMLRRTFAVPILGLNQLNEAMDKIIVDQA